MNEKNEVYEEIKNDLQLIINKYCFAFHELKGVDPFSLSEEEEYLRPIRIQGFRDKLADDLSNLSGSYDSYKHEIYRSILDDEGVLTALGDVVYLGNNKMGRRWKVI